MSMRDDEGTAPDASAGRAMGIALVALAALIGLVGVVTVVGLRIANEDPEPTDQNWWLVAWLVVGLVDGVAGAALATHYGHRRLGGCLLVVGAAATLVAVSIQSAGYVEATGPRSPWTQLAAAQDWARPVATGVLVALVPWELAATGRRRTIELIWWATAALIGVAAVVTALDLRSPGVDVVDVATFLVDVSATVATARLVVRWWRHRTRGGDPLPGWLAAGAGTAWLASAAEHIDLDGGRLAGEDVVGPLLLIATVPLLVVGALVTAMRERPGRFHGVAHDAIGWLVLSGSIVVVYTGLVAGLGRMVGGDGPTWLLVAATGAIAIAIEPARDRIRGAVDRLVWGTRDDPLVVVHSVVDHVGAEAGDDLLPALVEILQRELRLEAVAIDVRTADGWRRAASLGPATPHRRSMELEQRGQVVGRLVVGWQDGPSLRHRDERILVELAGPLGLAVGWARLAEDLRRSSVAIVSAREEERRRLRRDLHDGLGPALTGVSLGLRTAVRQLERGPQADMLRPSRQLLERSADEVDALVVEVKRIVRDLRPTVLDQLGLVEAVAEFARTFGDDLEIHLSMPAGPVELPAAVEVATYRIVTEAVTNVVRHARAARCWLTISAGPAVDIDVVDDGIGVRDDVTMGVGWTAMRERAAELGGSVHVEPNEPSGTRVHVRIPAVLP